MRLCIGAIVVVGLTTLAHAADHAASSDILPPAPALPSIANSAPATWSGVYIGVNAGYGGGRTDYSVRQPQAMSPYGGLSAHADGFVGGGQIGYNYVFGEAVLIGAEADIDATTIDNRLAGGSALSGGDHLDDLGTVRGRFGYAFGPVLVYGTGGFAYGDETANLKVGTAFAGSSTRLHTGYVFGGGVAYAFAENAAIKAEVLQVDLCSQQMLDVARVTATRKPTVDLVRAGIDVHFAGWSAPAPVVARY